MFEITVFNSILYGLIFGALYYVGLCLYVKRIIVIKPWKLAFYVTLFCLFGISGEIVVNNVWKLIFSTPLWEYRLFPVHGRDISYFFFFTWGGLGYYRYLNDTNLHDFKPRQFFKPGIIMGAEAIVLELLYNGLFYLLFGGYIFYYLPANMGFLSHLSCWQVIPFYFMIGLVTSWIANHFGKIGYNKNIFPTLAFFWMVITAIVLF